MVSRSRLVFVASSAVASLACQDPTSITFVVTTDVPCANVRTTSIAVSGLSSLENQPASSVSTVCTEGRIGTLVVVPSGGKSDEVAVRVVTGLDGSSADDCVKNDYKGGCIVARRALRFIPHSNSTVPISMDGSCRDVTCSPDQSCQRGVCVGVNVDCQGTSCPLDPPAPTRWRPMRSSSAGGVAARAYAGAVWTGKQMLVWGGDTGGSASLVIDGGMYDPVADAWQFVPPAPLDNRGGFSTVWTGKELIVWGGFDPTQDLNDGAAFDPAKGTWRKIAQTSLSARAEAAAVWAPTSQEMIVWGGRSYHTGVLVADGAAYDPVKDSWRALEPSPLGARGAVVPVWLGDRVLLFNGDGQDGATYDPVKRAWSQPIAGPVAPRKFAAVGWGGSATGPVAFWGGIDRGNGMPDDGVTLDPTKLQFSVIPSAKSVLADSARMDSGGWATTTKLWVWGGGVATSGGLTKVFGDGAAYEFATATWTAMPTQGAPSARHGHVVVWTGREAIVWGGETLDGKGLDDGAIFGP